MNEERSGHKNVAGVTMPSGALNAHKRLAAGRTDVESNPQGMGKPSTEKKIGNAPKTY
jgi:hypothetical protein